MNHFLHVFCNLTLTKSLIFFNVFFELFLSFLNLFFLLKRFIVTFILIIFLERTMYI